MMNSKIKSISVILTTLLIGMIIGFEASEIIVRSRFDDMKAFREPRGFVNVFEDIIKPDSVQKPVINSILLKYHEKIEKVSKEGMGKVTALMDSMNTEIKMILNNEQRKRFDEEMMKMKRQPPPPPGERMLPREHDMRLPPPPAGKMPPR